MLIIKELLIYIFCSPNHNNVLECSQSHGIIADCQQVSMVSEVGGLVKPKLVQFLHDIISNLDGAVNRGHKETGLISMGYYPPPFYFQ